MKHFIKGHKLLSSSAHSLHQSFMRAHINNYILQICNVTYEET